MIIMEVQETKLKRLHRLDRSTLRRSAKYQKQLDEEHNLASGFFLVTLFLAAD
jgi:hypothetical protein